MEISSPTPSLIPSLKKLWSEAFGDSEQFINLFFSAVYNNPASPFPLCRCVTEKDKLAAALYIFNTSCGGSPIAYLYAVATAKEYRGQGLCRLLMEDTHSYLENLGFEGVLLVPGSGSLFGFYEKMGYRTCSYIGEISCNASDKQANIRRIGKEEYAKIRRTLLPRRGVIQKGENLDFLEKQAELYCGDGFVLAARREKDILHGIELLGDNSKAPEIVKALGCKKGVFSIPGNEKRFAMYRPLKNSNQPPEYFGLAFN